MELNQVIGNTLLLDTLNNFKKVMKNIDHTKHGNPTLLKQHLMSLFIMELIKSSYEITYQITRKSDENRAKISSYYNNVVEVLPIAQSTKSLMKSDSGKSMIKGIAPKLSSKVIPPEIYNKLHQSISEIRNKMKKENKSNDEVYNEVVSSIVQKSIILILTNMYYTNNLSIENLPINMLF